MAGLDYRFLDMGVFTEQVQPEGGFTGESPEAALSVFNRKTGKPTGHPGGQLVAQPVTPGHESQAFDIPPPEDDIGLVVQYRLYIARRHRY